MMLNLHSASLMAGLIILTSIVNTFFLHISILIRLSIAALVVIVAYIFGTNIFEHWYDWLPIAAFTSGRLAETIKNNLYMRAAFFPATTFWLVFGVFSHAWMVVALEVITLAMLTYSVIKIYRKEKSEINGYGSPLSINEDGAT